MKLVHQFGYARAGSVGWAGAALARRNLAGRFDRRRRLPVRAGRPALCFFQGVCYRRWSVVARPPGRGQHLSAKDIGMQSQMVMYEAEYEQIKKVCDRLVREANGKVVFLVDKNGQLIASAGDTAHLDTTSLASLTAGNIAATGGIAKLINEKEFSQIFHEGERDNLHISIIGQRVILVVIFDQRSSLGLVRLRVRKASEELNNVFTVIAQKAEAPGASPFAEISDDDIDSLFS
jgi:predicted regulator of Ras-like GTPase activity (Roadblock/LC7/MglB family)